MKKKSRLHLWLPGVGVVILLAVAASIGLAPAYAEHCKGKHKNDPGCTGGNDPGAEIPVVALFDCPDAMPDPMNPRACPSSMNQHRVQGDGHVSYIDGAQDVRAHIRESGILQLRTDAKGEKPGERNIYWDFGSGFFLNSGDLLTTTDGLPPGFGHASVIQVGRGTGGLDFRTLENIGDTADTNLWANLIIKPNKGSKDFVSIRFEDPGVGDQCPDGSGATTITVTRLADVGDKRRWEIVGDEDATACIQGTGGDVKLGPFRFVVTEK